MALILQICFLADKFVIKPIDYIGQQRIPTLLDEFPRAMCNWPYTRLTSLKGCSGLVIMLRCIETLQILEIYCWDIRISEKWTNVIPPQCSFAILNYASSRSNFMIYTSEKTYFLIILLSHSSTVIMPKQNYFSLLKRILHYPIVCSSKSLMEAKPEHGLQCSHAIIFEWI